MTNDKQEAAAHPPLSSESAEKLLALLSSDDDFRELFRNDAAAALEAVGYPQPRDPSIRCTRLEKLADKDEIAAASELLKQHLTSTAGLTVIFCYEAGKVESSLKKK